MADPDRPFRGIPDCVAAIYDINGGSQPNRFGTRVVDGKEVTTSDIKSINGAKVGSSCVLESDNICALSTIKIPTPINGNYYEGAVSECQAQGGHLATAEDIIKLTYEKITRLHNHSPYTHYNYDTDKGSLLGITSNTSLWSGDPYVGSTGHHGENAEGVYSYEYISGDLNPSHASGTLTSNGNISYLCVKSN